MLILFVEACNNAYRWVMLGLICPYGGTLSYGPTPGFGWWGFAIMCGAYIFQLTNIWLAIFWREEVRALKEMRASKNVFKEKFYLMAAIFVFYAGFELFFCIMTVILNDTGPVSDEFRKVFTSAGPLWAPTRAHRNWL